MDGSLLICSCHGLPGSRATHLRRAATTSHQATQNGSHSTAFARTNAWQQRPHCKQACTSSAVKKHHALAIAINLQYCKKHQETKSVWGISQDRLESPRSAGTGRSLQSRRRGRMGPGRVREWVAKGRQMPLQPCQGIPFLHPFQAGYCDFPILLRCKLRRLTRTCQNAEQSLSRSRAKANFSYPCCFSSRCFVCCSCTLPHPYCKPGMRAH